MRAAQGGDAYLVIRLLPGWTYVPDKRRFESADEPPFSPRLVQPANAFSRNSRFVEKVRNGSINDRDNVTT